MEYVGLKSRTHYRLLEPPVFSGGEGKVFNISGESGKLAKIYHNPEKAEQEKLRHMVLETEGVHGKMISKMIAWPLDVLLDDAGRVCGFVMQRFPGATKLAEILPDKTIDWGKRVIIAWNLCEIVQDVEKMNQCIGDMNPSNFGVDLQSGHVYAFDADSFHFRAANGRLYPCRVGITEYYAPELQRQISRGQDLRTLNPEQTFSLQTDRFALAVLLFQLLFAGYHPFSARRLETYGSSTVVHRQSTNILNKVCAYFNPQAGTGIPLDAPSLDIIPPKMQEMFRQAFLTENRPSATEWQGVLTDLSRQLASCPRRHHYYSGLSVCPWCEKHDTDRVSNPRKDPLESEGKTTSGDKLPHLSDNTNQNKNAQSSVLSNQVQTSGSKGIPLLISAAWAFIYPRLICEFESISTVFSKASGGEYRYLILLALPLIATLVICSKKFPDLLKMLSAILMGGVACFEWIYLLLWLDGEILGWELVFGEKTGGVLVTGIVLLSALVVGIAGGKACFRASK